jgi:hypothetical protein
MKEVKSCLSPVYFFLFMFTLFVPSVMRKLSVCRNRVKLCRAYAGSGPASVAGLIWMVDMGILCDCLGGCLDLESRYFFLPSHSPWSDDED